MGQSLLIGWYNPASKRFCYKDEKDVRPENFSRYTQPVYAVEEVGTRKQHADELAAQAKEIERLNTVIHYAIDGIDGLCKMSDNTPSYEDFQAIKTTLKGE